MIPSIYPTDELFKALDNHLDGLIRMNDGSLSHQYWHRSDNTFMLKARELYKKFSKNPAVSSELIVALGVLGGLKIKTLISRHGEELVKTVIGHPLDPAQIAYNDEIDRQQSEAYKKHEKYYSYWFDHSEELNQLNELCERTLPGAAHPCPAIHKYDKDTYSRLRNQHESARLALKKEYEDTMNKLVKKYN